MALFMLADYAGGGVRRAVVRHANGTKRPRYRATEQRAL